MSEQGAPEGTQTTARTRSVGTISQSVPVPLDTVPFLLGKSGNTIKKISAKTGCSLHISDSPETALGTEWRYCSIRGSVAGVNAAKKFIVLYVHRHGKLNPEQESDETTEETETL